MARRFELTIDTGNAAFHDDDGPRPAPELARILREVADDIEGTGAVPYRRSDDGRLHAEQTIRDINGNRVGSYRMVGRR
jgi:hypothetical protein